jgi:hypothetical protein
MQGGAVSSKDYGFKTFDDIADFLASGLHPVGPLKSDARQDVAGRFAE